MRALILAAALLIAPPAQAEPCVTHAIQAAIALKLDPRMRTQLFQDGTATAFLEGMIEASRSEPPIDLVGLTKSIGLYINSNPGILVFVQFYGADGCRVWGTGAPLALIERLLIQMGVFEA